MECFPVSPGVRRIAPELVQVINASDMTSEYHPCIKTSWLTCDSFYGDLFILFLAHFSRCLAEIGSSGRYTRKEGKEEGSNERKGRRRKGRTALTDGQVTDNPH